MDWFIFANLPAGLINLIGPFALIVTGYVVEKNFVGRIATFTNSVAINLAFYGKNLSQLGQWQLPLILYLDFGLIIGVIALVYYHQHLSLTRYFYQINWAYSSFIAGFVVLISMSI